MDSVYEEFKIQRTVSQKPLKGGHMVDDNGLKNHYISDMEELILSPRAAFFLSEEPAHPHLLLVIYGSFLFCPNVGWTSRLSNQNTIRTKTSFVVF